MMTFFSKVVRAILIVLVCQLSCATLWAQDNPHGDLALDCNSCHVTEGWDKLKKNLDFKHDTDTEYPLIGNHVNVYCTACHKSLDFKNIDTDCAACHLDVHSGQFADDCMECHSPLTWLNQNEMTIRHSTTRYPLVGVHANLDCQVCHASGQYTNLPLTCDGCHIERYFNTANPNHQTAGFSVECTQCHRSDTPGWAPANFTHTDAFRLTEGHRIDECTACHSDQMSYSLTSSACFSCHEPDYNSSVNPAHRAGGFPTTCEDCHSRRTWNDAQFDHALTNFPLEGAHNGLECNLCHVNGRYSETASDCFSCHAQDYQMVESPNHVAAGFDRNCEQCHTVNGWQPSTFDHNTTAYPLVGAHANADCQSCHVGGVFTGTATECAGCHLDDYNSTRDPDHSAGQLPTTCDDCHSQTTWSPSSFDHNATAFALTGAHNNVNCQSCHINGQFDGTSTACFSCHDDDFNGTDDPDHEAGQFDHNCATCHTDVAWVPSTFNHANTNFPLTGAHNGADCQSCHINGQYAGTSTACFSCHDDDFNGTDDPDHEAGQFDHNCTVCHSDVAWEPANFDHDNTDFPLTGAHRGVNCQSCHINGQFDGTSTACFGCHDDDFNGTEDPDHEAGQFDHNCAACHTDVAWVPSTFNHANTNFPLTGAHNGVNCLSCHINGQYDGTSTACFSCHDEDFNGTKDPDHEAGQFDHNCSTCHTDVAWVPSTFNHSNTDFPLTGAHNGVNCQSCHVNGQFDGTSTACFSCHDEDFNGTEDPDHEAGQFDHNCATCHTDVAWEPATFDHTNTDFPLTGAHNGVNCQSCHVNGQFDGTSAACFSCHEDDFNGTEDPDHEAGQFDHNCATCHTDVAWEPATFDHDNTNFPLTGAHNEVNCQSCHLNGQYAGTPSDCYFCHEDDYNGVNDPNHQNAGFPRDCTECHSTSNWGDVNFNHDQQYFPIYTGRHRREWNSCSDCHVNENDYGVFSCIDCHEHRRGEMDDEHDDVRNYRYESAACYNCHPDGRAEDDFAPRNIHQPRRPSH